MKESVGSVDSGDCTALPDFSRGEQGAHGGRLSTGPESNAFYPPFPQAADKSLLLSSNRRMEGLASGTYSLTELVVRDFPWFMQGLLHKGSPR